MAPPPVGPPEACWSLAQHHLPQQREENDMKTSERGNKYRAEWGVGRPSEESTLKTYTSSSQSTERQSFVSNCLLHTANFMVISKRHWGLEN